MVGSFFLLIAWQPSARCHRGPNLNRHIAIMMQLTTKLIFVPPHQPTNMSINWPFYGRAADAAAVVELS